MPAITTNLGAAIDVSDTAQVMEFSDLSGGRRGSLKNESDINFVYCGWGVLDVNANQDAGVDKGWIRPGGAIRIPRRCRFFCLKMEAGKTAKVLHIED